MKREEEHESASDRFALVAQEFCSVIESASTSSRTNLLLNIYPILPRLIAAAIDLPDVSIADEDEESTEPGRFQPSPNVRLTDEPWGQLYRLLKEKLGDWDAYMQVFDPTEDKEAIFGTLADDLADIYRDLKEGLVLREKKLASSPDIIFNWRILYYSHWGKHAIDALLVLHFRLQGYLE